MATLEINKTTNAKGREFENGVIRDAVLAYVRVDKPDTTIDGKEVYAATAIVDSNTGKDYKKQFPKNSCNLIETSDIEAKFKVQPPNPNDAIHYAIKLKAGARLRTDVDAANLKAGDAVPYDWSSRPKVMQNGADVTREVRIGNGTRGDVHFAITRSAQYGASASLRNIEVTALVELPPYNGGGAAPAQDGNSSAPSAPAASNPADEFEDWEI